MSNAAGVLAMAAHVPDGALSYSTGASAEFLQSLSVPVPLRLPLLLPLPPPLPPPPSPPPLPPSIQTGTGTHFDQTATATAGVTNLLLTSTNANIVSGQGVVGVGITPGTTVASYSTSPAPATVVLSQSTNAAVTTANAITFLTKDITLVSATEVVVGHFVEGDGVPVGATVVSITGNTIRLSALTTKAINGGAIAFQRFHHTGVAAAGAYTVALDDATHVAVGQHVSGYGIQHETVITALSGITITMDKSVTATLVPGSLLLFQASSGVLTFEKSDACTACTAQANCGTNAANCLGDTSDLACAVASSGYNVVTKVSG